jgi:cytochrome oxidase Cu insertion factor (SCO1/SenC/PrrC family)
MRSIPFVLALLLAAVAVAQEHHHHDAAPTEVAASDVVRIPDVAVQTHDGRALHFYSDLVKGRLTAVNFIFTSCTTVCPLMGVRFAQLQPLLPKEVSLVSVSIDPTVDTPERLAAWGQRVGAKPGWTLVTGAKPDIDTLLTALGTAIADPASHTPLMLIIDDRGAKPVLRRLDGLTDPKTIAALLAEESKVAREPSPSAKYFANLSLVDQDGQATDLYSLMKGRTIVINSFFASCTGSCPVMTGTLNTVQERFADRVGKDLVLVSITVDPQNDTSAKLKTYATGAKASKGRYFLTGSKEQVDAALKRIGQWVESPEQHTNVMIVGNEKTGLWKKAFGLAKPDEIVAIVRSVLDDDGSTPAK